MSSAGDDTDGSVLVAGEELSEGEGCLVGRASRDVEPSRAVPEKVSCPCCDCCRVLVGCCDVCNVGAVEVGWFGGVSRVGAVRCEERRVSCGEVDAAELCGEVELS